MSCVVMSFVVMSCWCIYPSTTGDRGHDNGSDTGDASYVPHVRQHDRHHVDGWGWGRIYTWSPSPSLTPHPLPKPNVRYGVPHVRQHDRHHADGWGRIYSWSPCPTPTPHPLPKPNVRYDVLHIRQHVYTLLSMASHADGWSQGMICSLPNPSTSSPYLPPILGMMYTTTVTWLTPCWWLGLICAQSPFFSFT